MKKIFTFIAIITLGLCAKAQIEIVAADLEGLWTLSALEGRDSSQVLTPEAATELSNNFLHDFPLTTTTLNLSGSDFTLTHHGNGITSGTFEVGYNNEGTPLLILHVVPDVSCTSCQAKDMIFLVLAFEAGQMEIEKVSEDYGSTVYPHLTLTR